jgi:DNA polymerase I
MNILLVDATNVLLRAYYGTYRQRSVEGVVMSTIYTLARLSKYLATTRPPIVLAWDWSPSWRKKYWPQYKAHRVAANEEDRQLITDSFVSVQRVADLIGIRQVRQKEIEADDIIGLLVAGWNHKPGCRYIYSTDQDFNQLTGKSVRIIHSDPNYHFVEVGPKEIAKRWGVSPQDWAKFRALSGDASDGLKVLDGVGPKRAVAMLAMGVDPSVATIQAKGVDIKITAEEWKQVRLVYRLSKIPECVEEIGVSTEQRVKLEKEITMVLQTPWSSVSHSPEELADWLYQQGYMRVFAKRRQLWQLGRSRRTGRETNNEMLPEADRELHGFD